MSIASHKDSLGVFSDRGMYTVNGRALYDLASKGYPSIKGFSKEVGITRTRIYKENFKASDELRSRLLDLNRIFNNAKRLHASENEAMDWLLTPNPSFYNASPFIMAMSGKGAKVYDLQEELLGESVRQA